MQRLGDGLLEANATGLLAIAHIAGGDVAEAARETVRLCLDMLAERVMSRGLLIELLTTLALAGSQDDPREAAVLWGAAEHERIHEVDAARPREPPLFRGATRALCGEPWFDAAWSEGSRLTLEGALERALGRPAEPLERS